MRLPFATESEGIAHLTNTGGAKWSATTITYAFPTAAWFSGGDAMGFSAYTATRKAVERAWLKLWDDAIAANFVAGDLNGDGVADFEVELTGVASLTAADFV